VFYDADDDDEASMNLQCFVFLTTVDMGFDSQVLLYVRNISVMPVAKIQQAWDNFCWIRLYGIKFLAQPQTKRVHNRQVT